MRDTGRPPDPIAASIVPGRNHDFIQRHQDANRTFGMRFVEQSCIVGGVGLSAKGNRRRKQVGSANMAVVFGPNMVIFIIPLK